MRFIEATDDLNSALSGSYDPSLVVLSLLVACLASYAALGMAAKIRAAGEEHVKWSWLSAGAVAMGAGVWAMHFIGMLAFRLPVPVEYDLTLTLLSIIPAAGAGAVALYVISLPQASRVRIAWGGLLMGSGIGAMHFSGMMAMRLAARMRYDPLLFGLSIVVAIALATFALSINPRDGLGQGWTAAGAATAMGLAISGMHYTGMSAAYFFPSNNSSTVSHGIEPALLAFLVGTGAIVVLGLAIFVAIVDGRLKAASQLARTSRARMLETIESVPEGFSLYDADDRLVVCNRKYRELLQVREDEEILGQSFERIIRRAVERGNVPEASADIDAWVRTRLELHRDPHGPHLLRRSTEEWIQISERKTEDGGTVAIYTDITALKKAEIELAQALESLQSTQHQLVQSEKMAALGQLTAGIAHEINNPIGVVASTADNFERCAAKILEAVENSQSLDDVRSSRAFQKSLGLIRENSQVILQASARIAKIVQSLRTFARLDEATFKKVDVHEGIESALTLLQYQIQGRIRLVKKFGELPPVHCNAAEINQAMMTLLSAAVQSISGEGVVTVATSAGNGDIHVEITDTGAGLTPNEIKAIFNFNFGRAESRVGMVMGLPNAYRIIDGHGGEIAVSSEPGKGTAYRVRLPIETTRAGS